MKKYKNTIFVLCFLAAGLPLMIASIISCHIYTEETTKQNDLSMQTVEIQVKNDVETVLSEIRKYYLEESSEDEMEWLMKTGSIPYSQYSYLNAAQEVLSGPTYLLGYIEEYAFMNVKEGWILTNSGMCRMDEVKNSEQMDAFLREASDRLPAVYWNNNLSEPSPFGKELRRSNVLDFSGFHLVIKLPGTVRRVDQLLAVKLNEASLQQLVDKGKVGGYSICILDSEGQLLVHNDEALSNYCISEAGVPEQTEGAWEATLADGRKFRVKAENSETSGLCYVIGYDMAQVTEGGGRIIRASVLILGVVAIVLLLSRLITFILYRPVGELDQYVTSISAEGETPDTMEKADEFARIRKNVGQIISEKKGMEEIIDEQKKTLQELFLTHAVRGEMPPEEIASGQKRLGLEEHKYYRLLACMVIPEEAKGTDNSLGLEAFSLMAIRQMPCELLRLLAAAPFCYGGKIMLVIGAQEERTVLESTGRMHTLLKDHIMEQYGYAVLIGVSQVFPRLKYLRTACNECMEALRNTGSDYGDIAYYESIARNDGILEGYDFVLEGEMVRAVNSGNREEAVELVDKFINSLDNRCIKYYDRSLYIHRLTVAVMSVLTDAGLSISKVYGEDPEAEDPFIQMNYLYESDRLKQYLEQKIVLPAVEALHQYRYESSSGILRRVLDLVRETKGDITMGECAEKLNYHPSYLWKVLKAERNMTFTDLVNEEKINEAKKLLLHSDYSVAEIAEKLNYSNTQNFIRFFSNCEQMTPGKYRKEHRKADEMK